MYLKKLLSIAVLFSSINLHSLPSRYEKEYGKVYDHRETAFLVSGIVTQVCGAYNVAARSVLRMPAGLLLMAIGTSQILFYKKIIQKADNTDLQLGKKLREKLVQMKTDALQKTSKLLEEQSDDDNSKDDINE